MVFTKNEEKTMFQLEAYVGEKENELLLTPFWNFEAKSVLKKSIKATRKKIKVIRKNAKKRARKKEEKQWKKSF